MMRHRTVIQEKLYQDYSDIGKKYSASEIWDVISKSGIWKLPIEKQYGGEGLEWKDCISALEGLVNSSCESAFIADLVSHFSLLYLVSTCNPQAIKQSYLPKIMEGKREGINLDMKDNVLLINSRLKAALCELINIKKIVYGILISSSALFIVSKYKNKLLMSGELNGLDKKMNDCIALLYESFERLGKSNLAKQKTH